MTDSIQSAGNDLKVAGRVAAKAQLRWVNLQSVSAKVFEYVPPDQLLASQVFVSPTFGHWPQLGEDLPFFATFDVKVQLETKQLWASEFTFWLQYYIGENSFTSEELAAFERTSLALVSHSYARELVQSLTARAGMQPALTLATFQLPLDSLE
ncbi:MAG: hypothetical protein M1368_02240 [Thaumarchaeota archaeon]|nr:hypothetical protein [Nitrososphaerota archaeon]